MGYTCVIDLHVYIYTFTYTCALQMCYAFLNLLKCVPECVTQTSVINYMMHNDFHILLFIKPHEIYLYL